MKACFRLNPIQAKFVSVHLVASLKHKGFYWIVNLPMSTSSNLSTPSVFSVAITKNSLPARLIKPQSFLPSLVNWIKFSIQCIVEPKRRKQDAPSY